MLPKEGIPDNLKIQNYHNNFHIPVMNFFKKVIQSGYEVAMKETNWYSRDCIEYVFVRPDAL